MKKFNQLNREEMRNVKGGQGSPPPLCTINSVCAWFGGGISGPGHCDGACNCISDGNGSPSDAGKCTNG